MRIFIYSRKSKWTGRGESIENQIAMCREYIQHQIEGAMEAEIVEYEDEGYSGKNTNRPQFQKMMAQIRQGNCDYLVCYKLDRLGRNIADLANLVEALNQLHVSFISIKERFDTSTPIGKAMLYFAGVLAQMEREQIAERVRDNMSMLAKKGRWLGGNTPLGYRAYAEETVSINGKRKKSVRLMEDEEELKIVRFIFQQYLEQQSLTGIVRYFLRYGMKTKRGKEYTTTTIRNILTNPVYCSADSDAYHYFFKLGCQICMEEEEADGTTGLLAYGRTSSAPYKSKETAWDKWIIAKGKHKGMVSGKEFVKIQEILERNRQKGSLGYQPHSPVALLSGMLYCSCGRLMRPKNYSSQQTTKNGERRFSYLCPCKELTHGEKCAVANVQGNTLDQLVCTEVLRRNEESATIKEIIDKTAAKRDEFSERIVTSEEILKGEIQKQKAQIQHLIDVLAKSEGSETLIGQIGQEIEKRSAQCEALEQKWMQLRNEKRDTPGAETEESCLLEQLSSFSDVFDTLSVPEKRTYLKMVLDKVVWDGENAHVFFRDR